jgi:hypothetical protein
MKKQIFLLFICLDIFINYDDAQVIPGSIVEESIPTYLSAPAAGCKRTIRVVILRYLPTTDGVNIDVAKAPDFWSLGDCTLDVIKANIDKFNAGLKFSLEEGSKFHGYKDLTALPYLGYKVLKFWTIYDQIPISTTYQLYTIQGYGVYQPDFIQVYNDFGLQQYIEANKVDEVWIWFGGCALPGWPSYDPALHLPENFVEGPESDMASPTTGDISNSYRFPNDIPICNRTVVVYCYNFRRTQAEAVHDHGHQLESMFKYAAEQQDGNYNLFVHNFSGWGINYSSPPLGRAGDCHHPPNTTVDYDYLNTTLVQSDIEDWIPIGGPQKYVNVNTWANLNYSWPAPGYFPQQTESQWYIYWMQNMPGYNNQIPYNGHNMTNWWQFVSDWDSCSNTHTGLYFSQLINQQLSNITLNHDQFECYPATSTITLAGNNTTFHVKSQAFAMLVAGHDIHMLPGTKVDNGGFLTAFINADGTYCNGLLKPVSEEVENEEIPARGRQDNSFFSIYPNPSRGSFILEMKDELITEKTRTEIYDCHGEKVFMKEGAACRSQHISLSGALSCIYLVRVTSGIKSGTLRIIIQN